MWADKTHRLLECEDLQRGAKSMPKMYVAASMLIIDIKNNVNSASEIDFKRYIVQTVKLLK